MTYPFLAGQTPSAEELAEIGGYTPAITGTTTNPTLGANGEATGFYYRSGLWVNGSARVRGLGAGVTRGSGAIGITLPVPIDTSLLDVGGTGPGLGHAIGSGFVRHDSGASSKTVVLHAQNATVANMLQNGSNSRIAHTDLASADGNEYRITLFFRYPVAFGV